MRQAWYCPFCNAHHAPHVDTCPKQNAGRLEPSLPVREIPFAPVIPQPPRYEIHPFQPPWEITCGTYAYPTDLAGLQSYN